MDKFDNTRQITYLDILPRCYFLDGMVLFSNDLTPPEKKKMKNMKLDTYLTVFNIPNKLDVDHSVAQTMQYTKKDDMS